MSATTSVRSLVEKYYGLIDSGRLHESCELMTEDVKFTFANAEPVFGRDTAETAIQMVLDRCTAVRHNVVTAFEAETDGTATGLFELRIRFDLKNGKVIELPGCIFVAVDSDGRFAEQRLYADMNPVFAE
ncbi:nuclear transport factor 2 family protein [Nocardia donostiensis]|uniref:nuclear transport factor 2 family protein n=1 Tax=Nocardia donostiensis TaxID=1538463 RepID=UPI00158BD4E5|nr:nuclear transport factor 2 family protein [Nocardia donostiensis]